VERNRVPTNRNRIQGDATQDERAHDREVLSVKGWWRRSGGGAVKVNVLIRGDLALRLKGRSAAAESEKSAEAVVVRRWRTKG